MRKIWVYQQIADDKNPYLYASEYPVDEKELKENGEKEIGCYCSFKSFLVDFANNIKLRDKDKGKILATYVMRQIGYMFEDGDISYGDMLKIVIENTTIKNSPTPTKEKIKYE